MSAGASRWIRFLRNYGPIPTNDNMYDESIQRALRRHRIEPLVLPAQFLEQVLKNLRSDEPCSEILTGTAGDGKTYHCREAWIQLGGSEDLWNAGHKVQRLLRGPREILVVKDLSELRAEESGALLADMAEQVARPIPQRVYLIAANHGQLLEKLKEAPQSASMQSMIRAVEELLVTGVNPDGNVRLKLRDLSQAPASEMIRTIIAAMMSHAGWDNCETCPTRNSQICPIWENRTRLQDHVDSALL